MTSQGLRVAPGGSGRGGDHVERSGVPRERQAPAWPTKGTRTVGMGGQNEEALRVCAAVSAAAHGRWFGRQEDVAREGAKEGERSVERPIAPESLGRSGEEGPAGSADRPVGLTGTWQAPDLIARLEASEQRVRPPQPPGPCRLLPHPRHRLHRPQEWPHRARRPPARLPRQPLRARTEHLLILAPAPDPGSLHTSIRCPPAAGGYLSSYHSHCPHDYRTGVSVK